MLIIEFLGMPGAGKTTIADKVESCLEKDNIKTYNHKKYNRYRNNQTKHRKRSTYLSFCLKNIVLFFNIYFYLIINRSRNPESYKFAYVFFRVAYKIDEMIKDAAKNNTDVMILDQGLLQALWSVTALIEISLKHKPQRIIKYLLKKYYSDKKVIILHITADINTIVKRIAERKTNESRFDLLEKSARKSKLLKNNYFNSIFNSLAGNNINKIEVSSDNEGPVAVSKKIIDHIRDVISIC